MKNGNKESQEQVEKKMPRRVKKRRKIETEDGVSVGIWFVFIPFFCT